MAGEEAEVRGRRVLMGIIKWREGLWIGNLADAVGYNACAWRRDLITSTGYMHTHDITPAVPPATSNFHVFDPPVDPGVMSSNLFILSYT